MKNLDQFPILIIDDQIKEDNLSGQASRNIIEHLQHLGFWVIKALQADDGLTIIKSNAAISCILLDWEIGEGNKTSLSCAQLIKQIREVNDAIPIFIMTERHKLQDIELNILSRVNDYVWKIEDTPHFIAGRVEHAALNYLNNILPVFFKELVNYAENYKYAWHTPGHMGGVAFLKSLVGRAFYNFYGENVFRADLSVSVPELGSLMEHTGVSGEAERRAAKIFGAEYTYFVTNGTSTSNKIVMHSCVTAGDVVVVDRNCHKSLQHALTMTGAIPVYLMPSRNAYGIIGGIYASEFDAKVISKKIAANPLISNKKIKPKLVVITNSTYDGLAYDVVDIKNKLQNITDNLHLDEAWFSYAHFHELYKNRYAMYSTHTQQHPAIYSTQSMHKLLAAFSQASIIHVKSGIKKIDPNRFNEAFMMHTSTSPQYSIIASLDVAAKMMEGKAGRALIHDSIREAITFRKKILQIRNELNVAKTTKKDNWFFKVWQPNMIYGPGKNRTNFLKVSNSQLATDPNCWLLRPKETWHGYRNLTTEHMLLDPIKVSILTPGINEDGSMSDWGIPAFLLAKFLMNRGIVDEKTSFYAFLLLFSIGVTRSKSGTLLAALLEFKRLYDKNALLEEMLPQLVINNPQRYQNMTIQDLANEMHNYLRKKDISMIMTKMFDDIPNPVMAPAQAYAKLVENHVEEVKLSQLNNRIAAVMLVPYPPGIPIIMPGEKFAANCKMIIDYLQVLEDFDNLFPGFETETHGVNVKQENGRKTYYIDCVKSI
jgi:arginine decarboxylase